MSARNVLPEKSARSTHVSQTISGVQAGGLVGADCDAHGGIRDICDEHKHRRFLNVNGFLCPLPGACELGAHSRGTAQGLELSSRLRGFLPSPAELTLAFEVQNDFLEAAEEALYLIAKKSASVRDITYPPRWE